MNEPSPKPDPVVESAAALLRSREIPAAARARVLQGLEGAVSAPGAGWSLGAKLGLVALGGAAIVGIALRGASKPHAPHETPMRAPVAASADTPVSGRPPAAELSQPTEPRPVAPLVTPPVPHAGHPRAERKQAPLESTPETLAEQVRDFRAALAERNASQRAERLLAFQRKWPRSPLRHEVQLQLIAAYGQARDAGAQEAAAAKFIAEHPESARAGEVRAIAEGAVPDAGAPTRQTETER